LSWLLTRERPVTIISAGDRRISMLAVARPTYAHYAVAKKGNHDV
jgi:hypothetical protein